MPPNRLPQRTTPRRFAGMSDAVPQNDARIEPSWKARLAGQFASPHMAALSAFLRAEKSAGKRIYPPGSQIFRAFELTPFEAVKVVILGQDPYHGPGQAHGLSFSVAQGVAPPPSLQNIYKELATDLGIDHPGHGNLESWARQGVLLLNACLTVEDGRAGSHQGKGWEPFTDAVIAALNREREHLVFILWGRKAQDKGAVIDRARHLVLTSVHPSPLSASGGFFGSRPFSAANEWLQSHGMTPIDWRPS
jgi:uracil-DNA glycosylase